MRRGCLVCTTHTFGDLGGGKKTKGETVKSKHKWALVFTVGFLIGCLVGFLNPWVSSGIDIDFDIHTVVMYHMHRQHSLIFILYNTM